MDILVLLVFVAILCGWLGWVALRPQERNEASQKKED